MAFFSLKKKVLVEKVIFLFLDQQITLDPEILRADMKALLLLCLFYSVPFLDAYV